MDKITVAGNIFVDNVKSVDVYPREGMLSRINGERRNVGGCVCNTAISLAAIDRKPRVRAVGNVGGDLNGEYIRGELASRGVRAEGVRTVGGTTGYTDVYLSQSAGTRTFFNSIGVNASFCEADVNLDEAEGGILHVGYILLLPALDLPDGEYGTKAARLLANAGRRGIKTSIDAVSEEGACFAKLIPPALKYCDYAVLNEIEGGNAVSVEARDKSGKLLVGRVRELCRRLLAAGVREYAVIHCPEGGFIMDASGRFEAVPSLSLPEGYIKGTVGAGDAFCAGTLYGFYKGMSLTETLQTANLAAAACLSESDSVSGMRSYAELLKLDKSVGRAL
ncbi:MAG: carbohydrate kinase family protein [Clostridiales bacterium]|jgi:sugar/nucleoside kinase (ribokinase family)|nr:carbohydrate kinase family protein [Clostridiales bacterium]